MFHQLILRSVTINLIRILYVWHRSQELYVYYGETRRLYIFTISNGVLQGGILSLKLFFVYMDELSKLLILVLAVLFTTFVLIMCFMWTTYVLCRHAQ